MNPHRDKAEVSGYTKGPWSSYDDSESTGRHEIVAFGRTVARIYATKGLEEEDRANARLIAAAPELAEALADMVRYVRADAGNGDGGYYDADKVSEVIRALAALRKAGVEP